MEGTNTIKCICVLGLLISFNISMAAQSNMKEDFSWQGHRGARGLYPENSLDGFLLSMDIPLVNTLELDLVVSKDNQLIISHEPWMNEDICTGKQGQTTGKEANLYHMDYAEIQSYDCGLQGNPSFPQQKRKSSAKPLFEDFLDAVLEKAKAENKAIPYLNVELKSKASWYGEYCPHPKEYVQLMFEVLKNSSYPIDRICIQSFDKNILIAYNELDENQTLSFLVSFKTKLKKTKKLLGFTPDIISPRYSTLSKRIIQGYHKEAVLVIPWTVNEAEEMTKLINMGVDGIISDYPNLYERVNY